MRRIKIVLYLAGIFLAGIGTGVFISFQVAKHMMPNEANISARWCGDLQSKLSLTPEQMAKIKPIVEQSVGGFRATVTCDMLSTLSNCNAKIALQLTPEQKVKFEQFDREQRQLFQEKFGGPEAPMPGPMGAPH
jgi:Spy/CpxP family protein refolding chaperone